MDSFDVRLQPISFEEFQRRLEQLGIVDDGEFEGAHIFRQHRMGVATTDFYPVSTQVADGMVLPPTTEAVLGYFKVSIEEWVDAGEHGREAAE